MLVSSNWLKEFVDIDMEPEETAELLTMGGIEVESVTRVGSELAPCLTAKIEKITHHPNSDKLKLALIRIGDRSETVVCGAPNIQQGQIAAYAPEDTVLASGVRVVSRSVKGVESPGMLCSEKELGIRLVL